MDFNIRVSRNMLKRARHSFRTLYDTVRHCRSPPPYCMNTLSHFVFSDIKQCFVQQYVIRQLASFDQVLLRDGKTASPLIHFALSSNPRVLIQFIALMLSFYSPCFKEGAENVAVTLAYEHSAHLTNTLFTARRNFISPVIIICTANFNPLKTKRGLLYLKTQYVPRCKHFSSRL
jgi:hypothetical protein